MKGMNNKGVHEKVSAGRLLLILTGSIFVSEMLVMLFLDTLPPLSKWSKSLLDSALLTIPVFPILYFLAFRPRMIQIAERGPAEEIRKNAMTGTNNKGIHEKVSARRLLLVLTCSIFVSETLVMLFLDTLPPLSKWSEALLDSILLTIPVFPLVYFLAFRPLVNRIAERRLAEEIRKMLQWQQGVNVLQQSLLAPALLNEKLKTITDGIVQIFDADFCRIWLVRPGDICESCVHAEAKEGPHVCRYRDKCLHLLASSGRYTHIDGKTHRRVPFGCYKIGLVASGVDHKLLTNDAQNDPRVHNNQWARELGLKSFAGYQLKVPGGEILGALALFAKHPILPAEDAMLDGLGSAVAFVVQQSVADNALRQSKAELEQANKQLVQTVDKLNETNQELKNFVYIASHDLREPLRKISAFGTMLQKSLKGKIVYDDAENLGFMIDGANRMTKMIEGLLAYSRVSSKAQSAETVNLNDIIEQLSELELSVLLEEKHTMLDVPQPLPEVEVDPVQMRQVLQNLIANGIKYQAKDNVPHITLTSKPAADGMVRISVTDNGIGIAPEYQGAIFTMFKRLHSRNEYEGTGIGLAVCKKIVEQYGGKIGVESEPGKGSTFWFTVPEAARTAAAEAEELETSDYNNFSK